MLIEPENQQRQYEAIIEATSTNHDGTSAALTVPNGSSHIELIQGCMKKVQHSRSIAFWECHGTGKTTISINLKSIFLYKFICLQVRLWEIRLS